MKKVLITGANSYIGTSFEEWVKRNCPEEFRCTTIDMQDSGWRNASFAGYDSIFHVAGIAHADVGKVTPQEQELYYKVNCDLAAECAQKAKAEGVKQFLYMSSIIVYGDSAKVGQTKVITRETPLAPANFYGDSKKRAEEKLLPMSDDSFKIVILRPPMIYGKGSKGNYPLLAKLARRTPVFPRIENERSMLYIENLACFVALMIRNEEEGIFFPQNEEYVSTARMVREIAQDWGKKIWFTRLANPMLRILGKTNGKMGRIVNKVFGNMVYDKSLSTYKDTYQRYDLRESIRLTESE